MCGFTQHVSSPFLYEGNKVESGTYHRGEKEPFVAQFKDVIKPLKQKITIIKDKRRTSSAHGPSQAEFNRKCQKTAKRYQLRLITYAEAA